MSQKHTIFVSYHFRGHKPVVVIKYDSGKITTKTYKTVFDMPDDLRYQYWAKRLAHRMARNK